ncbi:MAG: phospholipid-binding protein MlaC [Burkholderiaceae bacterium]
MTKKSLFTGVLSCLLAVCGLSLMPRAALAAEAPDALVKRLSDEVLAEIKTDKTLQNGSIQKLNDLVDRKLMPHVNFERMTALAVGRGWQSASAEQRQQLMSEFRTLLIRTYAGALSAVSDQSVRMKPFRAAAQDTDVVVRSEVVQPRGEPVQLDYRLQKINDGWKIYDVNVLGVWLVQTYRDQFAREVGNGGIDGLIRSLVEKNKQFAPTAEPARS